jgi:hypothetical protein
MKKFLLISAIIISITVSCKKATQEPYGPTDIRIKNLTTLPMSNVMVNCYDTTFNFGTVNAQSYSEYHRFSRAYVAKANISAYISGVRCTTDTVTSYAYIQYLGQMKATYEVYMDAPKHLIISKTVPDSQLK